MFNMFYSHQWLVCLAVIFFLTGLVSQQSLYRDIIVNAEILLTKINV